MFCAIFSNGKILADTLECQTPKKSKWLQAIIILAQIWINFNQGFKRYCHFHVHDIFSNSP